MRDVENQMIRYRCSGCGRRLESDDELAAQEDTCPVCGKRQPVPAKKPKGSWRWLWATAASTVLVGVVIAIWPFIPRKTTPGVPQAPSPTKNAYSHPAAPAYEILDLKKRPEHWDYFLSAKVQPMTRSEVEALGAELIRLTKANGDDYLKAWLYYTEDDYYINCRAIFLSAGAPDFKLHVSGPVPEEKTPEGFFRAFVEASGDLSLEPGETYKTWTEFDPASMSVTFHDRLGADAETRLNMQAIVLGLMTDYLECQSWSEWSTIPGLENVTIHFYDHEAKSPTATFSYGRNVYQKATFLHKQLNERRIALTQAEAEVAKRFRAKVMSERDYREAQARLAAQIYEAYENAWVEVSPLVRIEMETRPRNAPRDYLRKYFFGG
jgi:DNA-directed RNA polymerase subunit RPC12/RpoP